MGSREGSGRTNGQTGRGQADQWASRARRGRDVRRAGVGVGRVRPGWRGVNGAAGAQRGRRHAWHRQTAHRGDAGGQPAGETRLAEVAWGPAPARRAQRCFPVAPRVGRAAAVAVREGNALAARRGRCLQGPAGLRQSRLGLSAPAMSYERPPGASRRRHPLAPPPLPGVLRAGSGAAAPGPGATAPPSGQCRHRLPDPHTRLRTQARFWTPRDHKTRVAFAKRFFFFVFH